MQYLYIMDPLPSINPQTDTTYAFIEEAQRRGIDNWACEISDLSLENGRCRVWASRVHIDPKVDYAPLQSTTKKTLLNLNDFAVAFMRKDPPVDHPYLVATMMLDYHDPKTTLIINDSKGLRIANEKLFGLFATQFTPKTVVATQMTTIKEAVQRFGRAVLKPIFQYGGAGVMVFDKDDLNLNSAIELLSHSGQFPIIVQEYLPEARLGDKRVILLGGKPIGALLRVPNRGDNRANLHVGGTAQKASVSEHDQEIAAALAPKLLQYGLHFVGIDIIDGKLTEINVTSPTCIQEIEEFNGLSKGDRLRAKVLDYIEDLRAQKP